MGRLRSDSSTITNGPVSVCRGIFDLKPTISFDGPAPSLASAALRDDRRFAKLLPRLNGSSARIRAAAVDAKPRG
jgi:hypothetical protein